MGRESSSPIWGLKWRSHTLFIIFAVGMGTFTDLFLYGLIVPVMPFLLRDRLNMPDLEIQSTISNLLAIYAGASFIASPVAGVLTDKFSSSRQIPYMLGLIMLILSTLLFAFGQSIFILSIARLLQGASGGVVWTLGMTIIIETVGQENLGKTMGTVYGFISVASLFSPIAGGVLYSTSGYNGVFGVGIALVGVDCILRLLLVEKKVAAKYKDSSSPTLDPATNRQNDDDTEETPLLPSVPITPSRYHLSQPTNRFTRTFPMLLVLQDTGLLTSLWIGFVQAILLGAFDATVPLVASDNFGFNSLKAGLLFLPLGGTDFLLSPVFGWAVDRFGTKMPSIVGFTALVATLALLRLPTEPAIVEKLDLGGLIALFSGILALNGIFISLINSPSVVEAAHIVESYYNANKDMFERAPYAQLYGINSMIFSAGLTVGPLVAGYLKDSIGYGNMNAVLAGICGVTAILSALFMGRKAQDREILEGSDE